MLSQIRTILSVIIFVALLLSSALLLGEQPTAAGDGGVNDEVFREEPFVSRGIGDLEIRLVCRARVYDPIGDARSLAGAGVSKSDFRRWPRWSLL